MSNSNKFTRKTELAETLGETKVKALDLYASKDLLGLSNEEVANACGYKRSWFQQLVKTALAQEYLSIVEQLKADNTSGDNTQTLYEALTVAKTHIFTEVSKGSIRHIEMLLKLHESIEKIETKQKAEIAEADVDSILLGLEKEFPTIDKCLNCKYKTNKSTQ